MDRLNLVTLGVKDILQSLYFYRDGLGFEVKVYGNQANPGVIFLNNGGSKLSLFPIENLAADINAADPPIQTTGFNGITLAYNGKSKAEVDEVMKIAKQAGAEIVKVPQATEWGGYSGYFRELNGIYWEVAYGEDWQFDEQDMLIID